MSALECCNKLKCLLNERSEGVNVVLGEEFKILLISVSKSSKIVGQRLDQNLSCLVILTLKSLRQLFDVHWHRLLQKLNISRLTNCDEHVLEGLQGKLSNTLVMLISHMLSDHGEERLNVRGKSLTHVLTNLSQDSEGASLTDEVISVDRDSLLTKALYLHLEAHIVIISLEISRLHLEVDLKFSIGDQLIKKHWHKLIEVLTEETSALC